MADRYILRIFVTVQHHFEAAFVRVIQVFRVGKARLPQGDLRGFLAAATGALLERVISL